MSKHDPRTPGAHRTASASKLATGLTEAELAIVIAVLSCQRAEGGLPSRAAIRQISRCHNDASIPTLIGEGWLESVRFGRDAGYRGTAKAWALVDGLAKGAA